jgi:hypothetical protein
VEHFPLFHAIISLHGYCRLSASHHSKLPSAHPRPKMHRLLSFQARYHRFPHHRQ